MKPEEKLAEWSAGWVRDGIIDEAQRATLLVRHPIPAGAAHRFLGILALTGGALLVVGVSLIIKSNWEQINDWVKISGLVTLLLTVNFLGWRLKVSPGNYPKTGEACLMAGAVFFFLGIALVSQIFHLESRPPNGVLLWWAGILIPPWLCRARGAQFMSALAGLLWLGLELGSDDSWMRLRAFDHAWYDSGYLLSSAGFPVGAALVFFGLGLRRSNYEYFAGLHEKLGLLLACVALYVIGFGWSSHGWSYEAVYAARWQSVVFLLLLTLVATGWAWLRNYAEFKPLVWSLLPGLIPVIGLLGGFDLYDSRWLWGGLACVTLFVLNLGMIRLGVATGREGWINLGIGFIALNIVTRYFLLFGTLLQGGVFFIVTGLLVLGLGWILERKRRSLVAAVKKEATP
jgi:succinate dehydrogenase hydrophobic anchor subunit